MSLSISSRTVDNINTYVLTDDVDIFTDPYRDSHAAVAEGGNILVYWSRRTNYHFFIINDAWNSFQIYF